jgi:hypothetical protein
LLLEAMGLAVAVELDLRRLSFTQVLSRVTDKGRRRPRVGGDLSPATVQRAIQVAFRLLPLESTCLKQALIFCRIYQRRGLTAVLRIGVQKTDNCFAAHAWVEDGTGHVLTDPLQGFSPVPLPAAAAIRNGKASG